MGKYRKVGVLVTAGVLSGFGCSSSGDSAGVRATSGPAYGAGGTGITIGSGTATSGGATGAPYVDDYSGGGEPASGGDSASGGGAGPGGEPVDPLGTNPFVIVEHDPLSTFGADVDTASYDIFRGSVAQGSLPDPNGVRLEEYVNFFDYAYPKPQTGDEHPFSISLAAAPSIFAYDTAVLRIGIQGAVPPPEAKKPANLVFLVDVSGSMNDPKKLPLVQEVLTDAVDVLDPTDTIAIVTYAGSTEVPLQPTAVADAATIKNVIQGLSAGGSTAGGAGITLAYQQAEAGFIEGGINHVILCTDGDFNVGLSTTDELLNLIVEKRKSGVTLTTLGFGSGDLNDSMMEAVSDAGNGIYTVITSSAQAQDYAENGLLSSLIHIAKDMKLQVEFNPAEVYAYRLLGYEDRDIADRDFRNDVVDAGEVGAGHRVTALYELVLLGHDLPDAADGKIEDGATYDGPVEVSAGDLVLVKVRYKHPDATETDPAFEVQSSLPGSDLAASYSDLDTDFQWALAISSFAEILRQSPYADPSRLGQIEAMIDRPVHLADADRAEFVGLFKTAETLIDQTP